MDICQIVQSSNFYDTDVYELLVEYRKKQILRHGNLHQAPSGSHDTQPAQVLMKM